MGALACPGEVEASAVTDVGEVLKDIKVLAWRNRGAVGRGEGLDGVLDRGFTGRLEYPADLYGSLIVAHERDGLRRPVLVGGWTEQGCDERLEEIIVAGPRVLQIGRSDEQRGQNASDDAPPVLVPLRERLSSGGH